MIQAGSLPRRQGQLFKFRFLYRSRQQPSFQPGPESGRKAGRGVIFHNFRRTANTRRGGYWQRTGLVFGSWDCWQWFYRRTNKCADRPLPFVQSVTNTTESSGGADTETDDAYRQRIRSAPESFSVAAPLVRMRSGPSQPAAPLLMWQSIRPLPWRLY